MRELDIATARKLADENGLAPVRVKGTDLVQLARPAHRFEILPWSEFEAMIGRRSLVLAENLGVLRVVQKA